MLRRKLGRNFAKILGFAGVVVDVSADLALRRPKQTVQPPSKRRMKEARVNQKPVRQIQRKK